MSLAGSFIEALHCCKKIVASDVKPVREFYTASNEHLVDHRKGDSLEETIINQLILPQENINMKQRKIANLDIGTCILGWEDVTRLNVATI